MAASWWQSVTERRDRSGTQHAPFLFINEMLVSGGPLSVLITNESVVVSITRATEMSNII